MKSKAWQTRGAEALRGVKTITAEEALKLSSEDKCTLRDSREKGELDNVSIWKITAHVNGL